MDFDILAILTWLGVIVGVIAGIVQIADYFQGLREKKKEARAAKEAAQSTPPVAPIPAPVAVPQTAPSVSIQEPEAPGGPPNNLPEQSKPLVGREKELAAVAELITSEGVRLLTLTGPGGTGKTRLSLEVAARVLSAFPDGTYFVPLAPLRDPQLVPSTIAQTIGLKERDGTTPLLDMLKAYLKSKRMLLLLDNFEQVVEAAPIVSQLLEAAGQLKVVVTSRAVLRLSAEQEFPVPPLELPDPRRLPRLEVLAKYEAITLFVQRAQVAKPYFALTAENAPAVTEICVRLDGLPLAIELAAARVKILTPQAMLERLSSRLQLLVGGARDLPARQQTLRGALDWSHDLLSASEQALFRRLSVFRGGCTLEAAEAVWEMRSEEFGTRSDGEERRKITPGSGLPMPQLIDDLESLVDKSLLRQETGKDGEQRFWMLETIREYAQEWLAKKGEEEAVHLRHAEYYLALAKQAGPKLVGPEQLVWLDRLEEEHDNFRGALEWLATGSGDLAARKTEMGLQLAGTLGRFWQARGYVTEGRERLATALGNAAVDQFLTDRVRALYSAAQLAFIQSDFEVVRSFYEDILDISREREDRPRIALALNGLGNVAYRQGDYEAAGRFYEESLAIKRELGAKDEIAYSLNNLGNIAQHRGDYAQARELFEESLATLRDLGDRLGVTTVLNNLGDVAFVQEDYAGARQFYEESLGLERELKNKEGIAFELANIGKVALRDGDHARARALLEESLVMRTELGDRVGIAKCLIGLAEAERIQNRPERGAELLGAADALLESVGAQLNPADRAEYERCLGNLHEQLSVEAFAAAWKDGQAMTPEQVTEYALRDMSLQRSGAGR
jgi:predicted ATPase/uncharacterized protein HemY